MVGIPACVFSTWLGEWLRIVCMPSWPGVELIGDACRVDVRH